MEWNLFNMGRLLCGHLSEEETLLDKGTDINHRARHSYTSVHNVVLSDHFPIVNVLIKRGTDKSIKDNNNKTPVDLDRSLRKRSIDEYLLFVL